MSLIDSKAVFRKRVVDLGIGELMPELEARGWSSFGAFTFATSYTPGSSKDDRELDAQVLSVLAPGDTAKHATLRRLHFEAYSITMGDLRRRAQVVNEEVQPTVMPQPEKADRFAALKRKFPSIVFDEVMEPSDTLVDKFHAMQERGTLRYVPWHELGRRDLELEGEKHDPTFKPDRSGVLRMSSEPQAPMLTDVSTTYKLEKALYRRGAAMHMAGLLDYAKHESLVRYFFRELNADPLPGYNKISIDQMQRVDKEIFRRLAEETRSGLGIDGDGNYPLDSHLEKIRAEPRIVTLMLPLPLARSISAASSDSQGGKRNADDAELTRLREEVKRLKARQQGAPQAQQGQPGGGKGNAKKAQQRGSKGRGGKGKDKFPLPQELVAIPNLTSRHNGKPICFSFNMKSGCPLLSGAFAIGTCKKGQHVCMRIGCGGDHPQHQCPKK